VEDALLAGLREWFAFVLERVPREEGDGGRMRNLTRITHLLVADMEEGRRLYQDAFWENLNIDYTELVHREFDRNLTSITKSVIDEACDCMAPVLYTAEQAAPGLLTSLAAGTQLFGLYLAMRHFYTLGRSLATGGEAEGKEGKDNLLPKEGKEGGVAFHSWFIRAVAKWLDIALYKVTTSFAISIPSRAGHGADSARGGPRQPSARRGLRQTLLLRRRHLHRPPADQVPQD
jgi:hypothetical protein